MAYRIRGQGQLSSANSRSGRGFIFDNRRITIKGPNFQLDWNGPSVTSAIMNAIEDALQNLGDDALKYMQSIVPVDTGATRDSCFVTLSNFNGRLTLAIGAETSYTIYIELGTYSHQARPFIRPTFDYVKQQLGSIIRKEVVRRAK